MSTSTSQLQLTTVLDRFASSTPEKVEKHANRTLAGGGFRQRSLLVNDAASTHELALLSAETVPSALGLESESPEDKIMSGVANICPSGTDGISSTVTSRKLFPCTSSHVQSTPDSMQSAKTDSSYNTTGSCSKRARVVKCTPREFKFPSLSLYANAHLSSSAAKIHDLKHAQDGGTLSAELLEFAEQLRRPMDMPLETVMNDSRSIELPAMASSADNSYLCASLRSLFYHLIHHRIDKWMDLLDRAIAFQGESDSVHKRVLASLQDVKESIEVDKDIKVSFRIGNAAPTDSANDEKRRIDTLEQERLAAAAITRLKTANSLFPSSGKKRGLNDGNEADRRYARCEQQDSRDELRNKEGFCPCHKQVSLPLVMEAEANVFAQIGSDLDQKQNARFRTIGSIIGTYNDATGEDSLDLLGAELDLNTEDLVASVEKEARAVARSAAESALIGVAADQQLKSNEIILSPQVGHYNEKMHETSAPYMKNTPHNYFGGGPLAWPVTPVREEGSAMPPPPPRAPYRPASVSPSVPYSQGPNCFQSPSASPPAAPALISPLFKKNFDSRQSPKGEKYSKGPFLPKLEESPGGSLADADVAGALTSLKHSGSQLCA